MLYLAAPPGAVSKSYALLLDPLRHIGVKGFGAVVFRRTLADVKKEGGLLDTSMPLYGSLARIRLDNLTWTFKVGAKVSFGHLEHETTVLSWQGGQVCGLYFDELTHFSKSQFFYMLSRNRSTCGIRPYVRATTNPDSDSWVSEFISWWIDQDTGLPIRERSGKLRWFIRVGDTMVWRDTEAELRSYHAGCQPKSVTFIPATLEDNRILTEADPGYRANLMALGLVERERLLGGNWKIRPAAGLLFRRSWCQVIDTIPAGTKFVRGWDLAGTPKTADNDPDWTVGTKIGRMPDGRFVVAHNVRLRAGPMQVERAVVNTASEDGRGIVIGLPQDPGQAGKSQVQNYVNKLAGFTVSSMPVSGDKITRFGPFSAQAEQGNVVVLRGDWNEEWFVSLEGFPDAAHDDDADATSEAFELLTGGKQVIPMSREFVDALKAKFPQRGR